LPERSDVHRSEAMPKATGMHTSMTIRLFKSFVSDASASAMSNQRAYSDVAMDNRRTSAIP
jgi:hypothetical protein